MAIGTRSNTPNDTIRIPNRIGQNQHRQVTLTIQHILFTEKKQKKTHEEIFQAKQSETEIPEGHWDKTVDLKKDCGFPEFGTESLIAKFITIITDNKIRDDLMKERFSDVKKRVEPILKNICERKNKKNTTPEALISTREREMKEGPLHKQRVSELTEQDRKTKTADFETHQIEI